MGAGRGLGPAGGGAWGPAGGGAWGRARAPPVRSEVPGARRGSALGGRCPALELGARGLQAVLKELSLRCSGRRQCAGGVETMEPATAGFSLDATFGAFLEIRD